MRKVGDLVYRVGYPQQGVGIVTQCGKSTGRRAIYLVSWQKYPVHAACSGWLYGHQLAEAKDD